MDGGFGHLDILILAVLAGFFLIRLANVLGRRTGHERQRFNPYSGTGKSKAPVDVDGKPIPVPAVTAPERRARVGDIAPQGSPLARALTEIGIADRQFDADSFLAGAKLAYEMIITAFAKGEGDTLKNLLGPEVLRDFEGMIAERDKRDEFLDQRFVGMRNAEITEAHLEGRAAEITVRFLAELISCTKNAEGAVIEGDPTAVREVRDLWTFARDTRSSDPNWRLVATHPG